MVDGKNDWFTEMRLFSVESEYHLALFPAPKLACNAIGDSLSQYDVLEAVGEFGEAIVTSRVDISKSLPPLSNVWLTLLNVSFGFYMLIFDSNGPPYY